MRVGWNARARFNALRESERQRARAKSDLARDVLWPALTESGIVGFEHNFQFAKPRRWRFDLSNRDLKIAIEVHGGEVFASGRKRSHAGGGLKGDCEKARAAALGGWLFLPFTGSDVKENLEMVVATVRAAIASRVRKGA